jgi:serine/threonine protein kinase
MAPEQVHGLACDHRADVFALGCVIYEMLSGQRAFRGETAMDTMSAVLSKDGRRCAGSSPTNATAGWPRRPGGVRRNKLVGGRQHGRRSPVDEGV